MWMHAYCNLENFPATMSLTVASSLGFYSYILAPQCFLCCSCWVIPRVYCMFTYLRFFKIFCSCILNLSFNFYFMKVLCSSSCTHWYCPHQLSSGEVCEFFILLTNFFQTCCFSLKFSISTLITSWVLLAIIPLSHGFFEFFEQSSHFLSNALIK